jgi:hypothetical protein
MLNAKKGGRPAQLYRTIRIQLTLSLHERDDADLIAWFAQIPTGYRPKAVMTALRQGGMGTQNDAATVDEEGEWIADDDFEAMLDLL